MKKRLDKYQLEKLLWHGKNAEVHLAKDTKSKNFVVIKLLHESFSDQGTDQQMRRQFLAEAEKLTVLHHPGIVRLIEVNFEEGIRPYFVMEYASGGTLRQTCPRGTCLPLETIRLYTGQIADALAYAHRLSIVHCDVKPENVLLDKNGRLLLSDFGISRVSESTLPQMTRDPFGTAAYMAPEQFKGKWDTATDQYALAIMIYEWFCGRPPFVGNRNQLMDSHLTGEVPSLLAACVAQRNDISPEVVGKAERVLCKALAKAPAQRFSHVQAFAQQLEEALAIPEPARLPTRVRQFANQFAGQPFQQFQRADGSSQQAEHVQPAQPVRTYDTSAIRARLSWAAFIDATCAALFIGFGYHSWLVLAACLLGGGGLTLLTAVSTQKNVPVVEQNISVISAFLLFAPIWGYVGWLYGSSLFSAFHLPAFLPLIVDILLAIVGAVAGFFGYVVCAVIASGKHWDK